MSQFNGLYIAVSGMNAHKAAIEVTGQNISNVSTKGYTRQEAVFVPLNPQQSELFKGQIGRGVTLDGVRRMTDEYLERRIQNEQAVAEAWKARAEMLKQVESSINSLDLQGRFISFWESWHSLALDPALDQTRFEVQQQGISLVDILKTARNQLGDIREQIEQTIGSEIEKTNILAEQIANLNKDISSSIRKGFQPNDLLDRRVELLKELVGITGAEVQYNEDFTVSVTIPVAPAPGEDVQEFKLVDGVHLQQIPSGAEVSATGGRLFGLAEVRDGELQSYLSDLDEMARNLADQVNTLHVTGYGTDGSTGLSFFQEPVSGAGDLELSSEIKEDLAKIGADGANPEDSGKVALEIFNVGEGFSQNVSSFIGKIGTETRNTMLQDSCHQDMLSAMENLKAEVSGVSLDEELANMVRFQRAYQASAKVLTIMDEILETLINTLG